MWNRGDGQESRLSSTFYSNAPLFHADKSQFLPAVLSWCLALLPAPLTPPGFPYLLCLSKAELALWACTLLSPRLLVSAIRGLLLLILHSLVTCQSNTHWALRELSTATNQSSYRSCTASCCPRGIPFPQKRSLSAPIAPNQTHLSDRAEHALKALRPQAFKAYLVQESSKQHLKSRQGSAIKNKPTPKSPILWTKPGKPPLRDTHLPDPAEIKDTPKLPNHRSEPDSVPASFFSCWDWLESGWMVHLKLH